MDSELLLKFIGYFPDYLLALSRTLLRFFGQPLSKQLYINSRKECRPVNIAFYRPCKIPNWDFKNPFRSSPVQLHPYLHLILA